MGVDTSKLFDSKGHQFLRVDDVAGGEIAEILGSGELRDGNFGTKFVLPVKIDGKAYDWTVNKTSGKELNKAFGTNTANWVGCKFKVLKLKQPIQGEMKWVLYAEPIVEPSQTKIVKPVELVYPTLQLAIAAVKKGEIDDFHEDLERQVYIGIKK